MTTAITQPADYLPWVDKEGRQTPEVNAWVSAITRGAILFGVGTPENNVVARATQLYMDTTGGTGNILYIKRDNDVGGDATQGWIRV